MAEDKADAVGAGQGLRTEQLNPHQHNTTDLAQERQRLPGLLGNTFEIRKKEIYEVLRKTAEMARNILEYLTAKKMYLIRYF